MRRIFIGIGLIIIAAAIFMFWSRNRAEPGTSGESNELVAAAAVEAVTQVPTAALPEATPTAVAPTTAGPTAAPTETRSPASPTPVPTPTNLVYTVEEFDTLLGIAIEFETTVEALVAANGIGENEFLQIGQELVIPTGEGTADTTQVEPADQPEPAAASVNSQGEELPAVPAVSQAEPSAETVALSENTPATVVTQNSSPVSDTPKSDTFEVEDSAAGTSPEAVADSSGESVSEVAVGDTAVPIFAAPPPINTTRPANINPLTGLPVNDPSQLQRRPLLVRIGNDTGARQSQAGLNSADVVYEEITEWWVTRFTAIYLAGTPGTVAPVRSARLINVQLAPQYQGALAHSGGSDPVRWEISQAPIVNLDEFFSPVPYYYRPGEGWQTRLAIDTAAARDYMVAQDTEAPVLLNGFQFSDSLSTGEPANNIFIPYPRATSFTQWGYDASSGKYLRWANANPLTDANGLGQVAASNVIIYFAAHQETDIVEDSNGATSIRIQMNGRGPAWFFRDGKLNKGFWQTDGTRTPYFGYEDGSPYELKRGNTWIEVVPTYFKIGLNSPDEASSSGP